jgi:hypothetical protein
VHDRNWQGPTARNIQSLPHPKGSPCASHSVFLLQRDVTLWYTSRPPRTTVVSRSAAANMQNTQLTFPRIFGILFHIIWSSCKYLSHNSWIQFHHTRMSACVRTHTHQAFSSFGCQASITQRLFVLVHFVSVYNKAGHVAIPSRPPDIFFSWKMQAEVSLYFMVWRYSWTTFKANWTSFSGYPPNCHASWKECVPDCHSETVQVLLTL